MQELGINHPHSALGQGNLGRLYITLERYSGSEGLLLLAFNTLQGALNSDHPYVKETMRRLNVLMQMNVLMQTNHRPSRSPY